MNRAADRLASYFWLAVAVARAAATDISRHWGMAAFSVVAGFGVWFAIQDVENPRVSEVIRIDGLQIEARNVPEGKLFEGATINEVRVQAREQDLEELSASDFEAWIDLSGFDAETTGEVDVKVRSLRDGVRALEAVPSTIQVTLVDAFHVEKDVQVNWIGTLPDGYELDTDEIDIEPAIVTVTGTRQQVESVESIQIDVTLSGRREETIRVEGPLVARSSSGNTVTVQIEPARAEVTAEIRQTFVQRTLPIAAPIQGHPAPGYRTGVVTYEPENVVVSGPQADVANLSSITLEPVDVSGATSEVQATRQIRIANISAQPTTVLVRVAIVRDDCEPSGASSGCATANMVVAVTLESPPPGLVYAPGVYVTQVRVRGSYDVIQSISPSDFTATASLAGGTAGEARYSVSVDGPDNVDIVSASPVTVTLRAASAP